MRPASTLVKALVVIGLVGLLIGVVISALPTTRDRYQGRTQCQSQMRQMGIALFTAQDAFGSFPPLGDAKDYPAIDIYGMCNWMGNGSVQFRLLPFLDEGRLILKWTEGGNTSETETNLAVPTPKVFLCPADPSMERYDGVNRFWTNNGQFPGGVAITNYVVNFQVWQGTAEAGATVKSPESFPDGAATTGMMYERFGNCANSQFCPQIWQGSADNFGYMPIAWGYSADPSFGDQTNWARVMTNTTPPALGFPVFQSGVPVASCDSYNTQGMHNGMNVLLGDGSVRFISPTVSATTWSALITPNGNDTVGKDFNR